MSRKLIFVQGIILIGITMIANVILSNWIVSKRIVEIKAGQISLVRSVDHIFTALTYMERDTNKDISEKVTLELDAARSYLRAPDLIKIRREVER